jgi:hypothetical protein
MPISRKTKGGLIDALAQDHAQAPRCFPCFRKVRIGTVCRHTVLKQLSRLEATVRSID